MFKASVVETVCWNWIIDFVLTIVSCRLVKSTSRCACKRRRNVIFDSKDEIVEGQHTLEHGVFLNWRGLRRTITFTDWSDFLFERTYDQTCRRKSRFANLARKCVDVESFKKSRTCTRLFVFSVTIFSALRVKYHPMSVEHDLRH